MPQRPTAVGCNRWLASQWLFTCSLNSGGECDASTHVSGHAVVAPHCGQSTPKRQLIAGGGLSTIDELRTVVAKKVLKWASRDALQCHLGVSLLDQAANQEPCLFRIVVDQTHQQVRRFAEDSGLREPLREP